MNRKFLNLNDDDNDTNVWSLYEMKQLREDERNNGAYVYENFDEWLNNKLDGDFEEITVDKETK